MNKVWLVSLTALATLAGCSQTTQPEKDPASISPMCRTEALAGGWSVSELTPEAQRAVNTVLSQMNTASKLKQVNEVRTQVVNGVNYAIEFTLENGEVWHTVVYRNLRNDYMIEEVAQLGPLCP
ncbi:2-oxoglutarate dehydrogenase [Vibrio aquaticus]|uniref:2-oxoglutarate dehydrogenase n=1 Tax=Vibrio aquaticus TaxID=2496559 RepID=A0A3S0MPY2_9VIBR|nr:cystatin domain-containing protein [Vibrio aquaticus]RTZ17204.1 2-oxoglutarate dehydrogenase [Vibrio aquaticus]